MLVISLLDHHNSLKIGCHAFGLSPLQSIFHFQSLCTLPICLKHTSDLVLVFVWSLKHLHLRKTVKVPQPSYGQSPTLQPHGWHLCFHCSLLSTWCPVQPRTYHSHLSSWHMRHLCGKCLSLSNTHTHAHSHTRTHSHTFTHTQSCQLGELLGLQNSLPFLLHNLLLTGHM